MTFDYTSDSIQAAEGGVYKSVSLNGGPPYNYFYDAAGRRRFKSYPSAPGDGDEFFYLGDALVEDLGISTVNGAPPPSDPKPIDEYIWLAGRPVVVLKGSFANWVRQPDDIGPVNRNGESANVGPYQLVTDYLGKPVVLLDPYGRVAGAADYDPFGNVNRATLIGETAHPYVASSGTILAQLAQPPNLGGVSGAAALQLRIRFALVDTAGSSDYAVLTTWDTVVEQSAIDASSARVYGSGGTGGRRSSKWVQAPTDGRLQVRYYSPSGSANYKGFAIEGYEYRRYQSGTTPVPVTPTWVPLRLPGQYYDAESELFQNRARFYDPQTGRMLQPDAAWTEPALLLRAAASGHSFPIYAYAFDNPLTAFDPSGNTGVVLDGWNLTDLGFSGGVYANSSATEYMLSMIAAGRFASGIMQDATNAYSPWYAPAVVDITGTAEASWLEAQYYVTQAIGLPRPMLAQVFPDDFIGPLQPWDFRVSQVGNIVYNETRSLVGSDATELARLVIADAIINNSNQATSSKSLQAMAPATVGSLANRADRASFEASQAAASRAFGMGDFLGGARNYNMRPYLTPSDPFFGLRPTMEVGPLGSSAPNVNCPDGSCYVYVYSRH